MIPAKLAQLYLKDILKSLLYFGDLDPIFKVTNRLTEVDFIAKNETFLEQMDEYSSDLSGYIVVTDFFKKGSCQLLAKVCARSTG